jgi:PAS domain S-box-containing protein
VDVVIDKIHVIALCQYNLNTCSTTEIIDVVSRHQFALIKKNGKWKRIENFGQKRMEDDSEGKLIESVCVSRDIKKLKQEEHRINRYNRILEGINQIFSSIVQVKTKEELGEECLSVALKITGSEFGFINEMGDNGLLHDIAKSELGWEQCFMYDKTGHLRPPSNFAVHGLYGSVIINEKGFFTNDPLSHPDSIGLPDGHPPITSFLGVPLVQEGKTIGLIAVANREGGYSYEQQKDLEAIAPAVTQAFQRKRSEEAMKLLNIYNRSLIEASLDPLVTIGRDGKITDVNVATELVTGYSRNYLIGTDFSDYFTESEEARKGYQQVFRNSEVRDYPLWIHHKDGHITPVLYNASVYRDKNDEVIGVFAAARDITEIQKAEEKIKTLANAVESSEDAIITKSLDGIITSWNKGAEQVYGYTAKEIIGKCISILEPENLKGEVQRLSEKIKQGKKIQHYETSRVRKDGTIINISVALSPIFDATGKLTAISAIARDITESKKAEETIRLSNIYNRSLIEASLDPLVTIGPDGKITDVNVATELITGYSRNKLIGTDFSDYFTEPEKARTGYQRVFRDGEVRDYPLWIHHKDGHITPVLYNASVYKDENDKVIGVFAAARDIIERKKAEEALKRAHENLEEKVKERTVELEKAYNSLKESENGLAEAQKMSHIGNWEWDIVTDKAYWSDEMYRIFGRNPQELAPVYNEFLNYIHPDDRDYLDSILKKAVKGETYSIDYRVVLADGEERIIHMQSEFIFDEKNIPVKIKGIIQDITEHKKAEEKIQTLANAVESSNDAIITLSLDGIITSWNKAAEQIYGYPVEEILGKEMSMLEPDDCKGEIKRFSEKIKQGENVQHYESIRIKKDGTIINISVVLSPVYDVLGKLVAISAIVRDITEHIKAEEALRESEARLRQFYESDMIGVFYYNLDGSIVDANDTLLEIIGYTREDLQTGRVRWDKITPLEYRHLGKVLAELRSTGVNKPYEKEYIRKNGSRVPVIVGVATFDQVRNEGIAFVLDITDKKKAEKALANLEIARKKEIHHRIKNNLQVISSLLDLQADKFDSPKVIEAFRESQNRVISMALIHEELYKGEKTDTLDFSTYIRELAENLFKTYSLSSKKIHLTMDLEENAFFDMDVAVPLGIIVNELVSNALKHAFLGKDSGEIQIKLHRQRNEENKKNGIKSNNFILTVSDNGVGISRDLDIKDLESLGIQLITTLVDQLDGELELKNGNGTEFSIRFTIKEENN